MGAKFEEPRLRRNDKKIKSSKTGREKNEERHNNDIQNVEEE